ncbi:UNVERIFIED_CONTAM: hypothetical protein FKN15_002130 [Acipenser sinensis]
MQEAIFTVLILLCLSFSSPEEELLFQAIGILGADGKVVGSSFPPRNSARRVTA